jgi:hypothetical protein
MLFFKNWYKENRFDIMKLYKIFLEEFKECDKYEKYNFQNFAYMIYRTTTY